MADTYDVLVRIFRYLKCLTPASFVCKVWNMTAKDFTGRRGVMARGLLRNCAREGHISLMKWALANGAPRETRLIKKAIKSGNMAMIKFIMKKQPNFRWNRSHTEDAILSGNVGMLQRLYKLPRCYIYGIGCVKLAIQSGNIDMVKFCIDQSRARCIDAAVATNIIDLAIRSASPEILDFIIKSDVCYANVVQNVRAVRQSISKMVGLVDPRILNHVSSKYSMYQ